MRVLQIIDSLDAGGAERMAINFHNHLNELNEIESFLISTRKKGQLLSVIKFPDKYCFLNRTKKGLFYSLLSLNKFLEEKNIQIIHVHGTSIFFVGLLKILKRLERIRIIWHDHNGNSPNIQGLRKIILFKILKKIEKVLVVSNYQKTFYEINFKADFIQYLPNYSSVKKKYKESCEDDVFRIVLTANLRYPKNHLLALRALNILVKKCYKMHLTFIGRITNDDYFIGVENFVFLNKLDDYVTFLGEVNNTEEHLHKFDLGILTSFYEGFPVSLIEYGIFGLPVVTTDVGECSSIIGGAGTIISSNNLEELVNAIEKYYIDRYLCDVHGRIFRERVMQEFSRDIVLKKLVNVYSEVMENGATNNTK
ncbi:putative glycosyl transferase [Zunongwangia profunda SM-A87]|uniref:Glycosyl transferase n=1 Tax=Zunongwangia profunda (strain DSM 18752 / CCTCC AB 206139 / SM-A87) TaxID=655815 RepID=D5BIL5_ZUNPS|nr:glycosyltransferase [Zunongwangia profunda]ADF51467.1 putative glycosyl transferase [Zunongwangia profunda SM-A87]|tara:strand:- start:218 stop:1315 length:1098 start_codon:yes stop_codon:yes gene_type:complete